MSSTIAYAKLPIHYSGKFIGSFAYTTIKDRLPVILVKVLDTLCQDKNAILQSKGEEGVEDIKKVVGRLSALQNEMVTNKPIKPLISSGTDVSLWNSYLDQQTNMYDFTPAWFDSAWLYVECYLYRRMWEAFELSSTLTEYDAFHKQKLNSLITSFDSVEKLGQTLHEDLQNGKDLKSLFLTYLQVSLWGNKCDLSISAGVDNAPYSGELKDLRSKILVNDSEKVWNLLQKANENSSNVHIHIILDNAGFELFGDFCLLDFLVSSNLVKKVTIHPKVMPWFVSDTLEKDIDCLLETFKHSNRKVLEDLNVKWRGYLDDRRWIVENDIFWTLPHDYSEMSSVDSNLYSKLSTSELVIFKGDLNYRKLTGDRMWDETTSFETALNGFSPSSLLALRTVKCDVVVGLEQGTTEKLERLSPLWKRSGEYAVIQCLVKEEKIC